MQFGGQPSRISDFDLMTELDVCLKQAAAQSTAAILESATPPARQQFQTALQTCLQHQQQLANLMMQKGYYRPLPASAEMLQVAREQIAMASAQVGGPHPPGLTQNVQPAMLAPATGTGPIPPQAGVPQVPVV